MSLLSEKFTSRISMRDVANKYGLKVTRSGFTLCPFHQDKHPSMKIYDEIGKGYFCFTCNKGGSVINFVMEYFKIEYIDSLKKLDNDFGLNVLEEKEDHVVAKEYAAKQFIAKRKKSKKTLSLQKLVEEHCRLHNDLKNEKPFSEKYSYAVHHIDYLDYLIENKMNSGMG
jgi:DNA primase